MTKNCGDCNGGCCTEAPSVEDSKRSTIDLNKEVDILIDKAMRGDMEAAKRANILSRQILRRQGIER